MLFVAERFIVASLINKFGKHSVSTADGSGTWYPQQACDFLKLKEHHLHSSIEKRLIERTIRYIKDRTNNECFDDYFPCRRKKNSCKLQHVKQWFALFIDKHNKSIFS